jgi:amino acid transporter
MNIAANDPSPPASSPPAGRLGTFAGVFTPSVLTILGIILFLRLGYVVGSAGLAHALVIIALANVISVLTSISISAVATNLKVRGGGDYYLISRTLGLAFGGALGLVLFLAQSVSIAFYCIGFGEAVAALLPALSWASPRMVALSAVALLFVMAWLGADWATRFQFGVMAFLTAALAAFFAGGLPQWDAQTAAANWVVAADGPPFWVLFAIFFPAVTGFTQGVSMSGDLADPGKSLPKGTFAAVGLSIVVYLAVAVVFAGVLPAEAMRSDYGAMKRVAAWPWLIDAGVIAATLSSAMASFLGAPRILQSLARDRIFPVLEPFAAGNGPADNPRKGVALSLVIAVATVLLGNLNLIAPVVSMFFLISYGLLNAATYYEASAQSPSFRPRFRWFHPRLSLLGAVACLGVMLAIDVRTGIVAVAILVALYQYLKRTAGPARWADSQRSHHFQRIRAHLLAADHEPEHPRDWRPHILAFSDDPERRRTLLRFADWLEGNSGTITLVKVIRGRGGQLRHRREAAEMELRADISAVGAPAFPLVVYSPDTDLGHPILLQSFGIGPLKANMALVNWLDPVSKDGLGFRELRFGRELKKVLRWGCHVVLLHAELPEWHPPTDDRRCIDVYWRDDATGRLMLLMAYLVTRHPLWEQGRIRLLAAPVEGGGGGPSQADIRRFLDNVRIEADILPIADISREGLGEQSADAGLVFLPFRFVGQRVSVFGESDVDTLLEPLPMTALVSAAADIELDAAPEEGLPAEIAAAQDDYQQAVDNLQLARKEALEAERDVEEIQRLIAGVDAVPADPSDPGEILKSLAKTEEKATRLRRRLAKMQAKAENAEKALNALGIHTQNVDGDADAGEEAPVND